MPNFFYKKYICAWHLRRTVSKAIQTMKKLLISIPALVAVMTLSSCSTTEVVKEPAATTTTTTHETTAVTHPAATQQTTTTHTSGY